jgi:uncharacterized repeat protein (TIGR02543 family)
MSFSLKMTRRISFFAALLMALTFLGFSGFSSTVAHGSPTADSVSLYIDSPFVQGSYVAEAGGSGVKSMSFNGTTGANRCGDGQPAGIAITGTCTIYPVQGHAGATPIATNSTPTVGGSGSNFPSTTDNTSPIIITLTEESRYIGLWWSAGSSGNTMKFFNGNTLLLTLTTADIMNLLGTAPANNTAWQNLNNDSSGNTITSINGTTLNRKVWYFGNPRGYGSATPTSQSTLTTNEPFVYLHMFTGGLLTFNKVELSGSGFEFDNLAVSSVAQTPNPRLALVSTTNMASGLHIAQFSANGSGVQGTMENQIASTSTALRSNTYSRTGYTFTGWNTASDGTGTGYTNSQSYSFTANVDLFAQWQPLTYAIAYDSQGGTGVSDGSYATGSTVNLAAAPTREGYTFNGWFTSASGGTPLGSSYSPPATGNITLYAQWETNAAPAPAPAPNPAPDSAALASTGSTTAFLLGAFGLSTVVGLLMLAQSIRLRRQ